MSQDTGMVAGLFTRLDGKRSNLLERCRRCSALTVPHVLPPEGNDEDTALPTPYQSLGARVVNNLASKLMLTLFPPNSPFFRYDVEPAVMAQLKRELGEEGFKTRIRQRLGMIEQDAQTYFEMQAWRVPLFRALRMVIITGNALIEFPEEGRPKVHRIDNFVIRRSPSGRVLEIITKESITKEELPEGFELEVNDQENTAQDVEKTIDLYTYCKWSDGKWNVHQEILGKMVPDSDGTYTEDEFPYIPLTWMRSDGYSYGTGQVEEYLGDFQALDGLNKALLEGAAAAARIILLVNPNGNTYVDDLQKAKNGDFVEGNAEDITILQLEKLHDFQIAFNQAQNIEQRLSRAFLLHESVQRDAERVTAEEIRYMAQELNDANGGIYSLMSLELQLPLVKILMSRLADQKKLPELPKGVKPTIITGFDSLGRGHDLQKLVTGLQYLEPLGPDVMRTYMVINDYIDRVFTALGVDTEGLIRSEEQVQQIQQQNQMQALIEKLGPEVMKQMGAAQGGGGQQNVQS